MLGGSGQLWAYSTNDHTVIREVEAGHWMEFRGSGMDEATYRTLLDQLRIVGIKDYELALGDAFIAQAGAIRRRDRDAVRDHRGLRRRVAWRSDRSTSSPNQQDPYQLGAEVTGQYTCAWLDEFAAARDAGDDERAAEAARVLGTSREWPVLQLMDSEGDFPDVVWQYADDVAAGRVPEGYKQGLGCP